MVVLALIAVVAGGCKDRETASGGATETIEPAKPQPAATDSDAMTQTVDIEAGRSEAEGGGLSSPSTAQTTETTATTATTENPTTKVAPPSTTTR